MPRAPILLLNLTSLKNLERLSAYIVLCLSVNSIPIF